MSDKTSAFFTPTYSQVRVVPNGVFLYRSEGRLTQFIRNKRITSVDHTSDKNIVLKSEDKILAVIGKIPNKNLLDVYNEIVSGWNNFWVKN